MKKIAVILLLSIQLFNCIGYRIVAYYYENSAFNKIQAQIDSDKYDPNELISIKVPFSMPYGPGPDGFEKVDGSIDYKGVTYQYVKRRFYKDSLEVLCIPNIEKASIAAASNDFSKSANDITGIQSTKKATQAHSSILKYSVQEFTTEHYFDINQFNLSFKVDYSLSHSANLYSVYIQGLDQPPEINSTLFI